MARLSYYLPLMVALAAATVGASAAHALTITPAGTAFTANLTSGNVVITDSFTGETAQCNTHVITGKPASPASASMQITAGAANKYSDTGTALGKCPYTGFGTGLLAITVTATWTLTMSSLAGGVATGSLTLPASALSISSTGSLNCVYTANASTVPVSYTNSTHRLTTNAFSSWNLSGCLSTPTWQIAETLTVASSPAIAVT